MVISGHSKADESRTKPLSEYTDDELFQIMGGGKDPYAKPKKKSFWSKKSVDECWLDNLPGTKNDAVANEIAKECWEDGRERYSGERKSGMFGGKTAGWCVKKYNSNVSSKVASDLITAACYSMYVSK